MEKMFLGIDIGGTKTALILSDEDLNVIKRTEFSTHALRGFEDYAQRLSENIDGFINGHELEAVGVSVGGPLDTEKGLLFNPPHLPWGEVDLLGFLKDSFSCPINIEHDAKAGALAEYLLGAGKGFKNLVFLTLGTGLGAGIILNGRIYRGFSGLAGEIGHISIGDDGPVMYGKVGSWESYCSGAGIAKLANYRYPELFPENIKTSDISQLAYEDDEKAISILVESGKYLGKGLAIILDILEPDRIILGNLSWRLPSIWLDTAYKVVEEESILGKEGLKRIVISQLKGEIGDFAALVIAVEAAAKEEL